MIAGLRAHLIDHRLVLLGLGGLEAFLSAAEDGRGIGHRLVQPEPVEIIAQVVMVGDVLAGLHLAVRLQPEAHPFVKAQHAHAGEPVIDAVVFGQLHQIHQRLQVRRGPPAFQIGIAKAQIAFADQTGEGVGVVDFDFAHRAGPGGIDAKAPPVGQNEVKPPAPHALGHLEGGREIARQAGLALDAGGYVHGLPTFLLLLRTPGDTRFFGAQSQIRACRSSLSFIFMSAPYPTSAAPPLRAA